MKRERQIPPLLNILKHVIQKQKRKRKGKDYSAITQYTQDLKKGTEKETSKYFRRHPLMIFVEAKA